MAIATEGNATLTLRNTFNSTFTDTYYFRKTTKLGLGGTGGYSYSSGYTCDCYFDNAYHRNFGYLENIDYPDIYIFKSNGVTVGYKVTCADIYKYVSGSSGATYKLTKELFSPIFGTNEVYCTYHNSTDGTNVNPFTSNYPVDDIETLIKQFFTVDNNQITKVKPADLPEWIAQNLFNYNLDPVYAPATQINYTDGTYEIIRDVLTEQEAKDHAYKNLLNTYGTFYKATEVEINEQLNKITS